MRTLASMVGNEGTISEYNRDKAEGFKIDTATAEQLYEDPQVF